MVVASGVAFGIMLAGFVPMGAIVPALAPDHKGAAMAVCTRAAGGAAFSGAAAVAVAVAKAWGGNVGVVWAFIVLYAVAVVLVSFHEIPEDSSGARSLS